MAVTKTSKSDKFRKNAASVVELLVMGLTVGELILSLMGFPVGGELVEFPFPLPLVGDEGDDTGAASGVTVGALDGIMLMVGGRVRSSIAVGAALIIPVGDDVLSSLFAARRRGRAGCWSYHTARTWRLFAAAHIFLGVWRNRVNNHSNTTGSDTVIVEDGRVIIVLTTANNTVRSCNDRRE